MLTHFLKVKGRLKQMDKLTVKDLQDLRNWVDQMYWDWDRMSSSGQETLDKIADKLGLETSKEVEARVEEKIKTMDFKEILNG
jgi:hypothetical protein